MAQLVKQVKHLPEDVEKTRKLRTSPSPALALDTEKVKTVVEKTTKKTATCSTKQNDQQEKSPLSSSSSTENQWV